MELQLTTHAAIRASQRGVPHDLIAGTISELPAHDGSSAHLLVPE